MVSDDQLTAPGGIDHIYSQSDRGVNELRRAIVALQP